MKKREFVQLSKVYKKQDVRGWFESSKLDGFRAVWDGGVTRGMLKKSVPWANTDKDDRYVEEQVSTGLWSRYGNVVHAPDWYLDMLPKDIVLDGEFFNPEMSRQQVRSICAKIIPTDDWARVQYHVFNRLSPEVWLGEGRINNPNFKEKIIGPEVYQWYLGRGGKPFKQYPFNLIYGHLQKARYWSGTLRLVEQTKIPDEEHIGKRLIEEMAKPHGEGLILSNPYDFTVMQRTGNSLKVKPRDSSEAIIVGYISGREGKLRGMLGALIVDWDGTRLELSGFTNLERSLSNPSWADNNLEAQLPAGHKCFAFPIGHTIGFSYRGLTDDGVPAEAVYDRTEGCYASKEG